MIDRLPADVQCAILERLPEASALAAGASCEAMRRAASGGRGGAGGRRLAVACLMEPDTLPPSDLARWAACRAGAPLGDAGFLLASAEAGRDDLFRLSLSLGAPPGPRALCAALEFLPLGVSASLLRGLAPATARDLVRECDGGVRAALGYPGGAWDKRDGRLARFEWCVLNGFRWNAFEVCRWAAQNGDWRLAVAARRMSGRGFPSWSILADISAAHGHAEASLRLAPPGGGPPAV